MYKSKYAICLYDLNDNLVALFENTHELCRALKIKHNGIYSLLRRHKTGELEKIKFQDKWCKIILVDVIS